MVAVRHRHVLPLVLDVEAAALVVGVVRVGVDLGGAVVRRRGHGDAAAAERVREYKRLEVVEVGVERDAAQDRAADDLPLERCWGLNKILLKS